MAVSAAFTIDFMKGSVGFSNTSEKLTFMPSMRRLHLCLDEVLPVAGITHGGQCVVYQFGINRSHIISANYLQSN